MAVVGAFGSAPVPRGRRRVSAAVQNTSSGGEPSSIPDTVLGPPPETKPDYDNIVGPLGRQADDLFLNLFRTELANAAQVDSDLPGYPGLMEIALQMSRSYPVSEVQTRAHAVLVALFPSWMPPSYKVLFSEPFPSFSARMNAWATYMAGTWLMGECELNDIIDDNGNLARNQGLLVKRCRFLEESGCASVCVNACKLPTQRFFQENMGLPLTMEPDYETFECQFSFGKTPTIETEASALATPCLARCPAGGALRSRHRVAESCPQMNED